MATRAESREYWWDIISKVILNRNHSWKRADNLSAYSYRRKVFERYYRIFEKDLIKMLP